MRRVAVVMMMFLSLFVATPIARAESTSSEVIVLVGTTIDLEISSDSIVMEDIQPGMFVTGDEITVSTWTNDEGGVVIFLSAGDGTNYTNSNLIRQNSTDIFSALPTNQTFTSSNFPDSSWGASVDSGQSYFGVPYSTNRGVIVDSMSRSGTHEINFMTAAKAGFDVGGGAYENVLVFTAISAGEL